MHVWGLIAVLCFAAAAVFGALWFTGQPQVEQATTNAELNSANSLVSVESALSSQAGLLVSNPLNRFDRIYYINLPGRQKRELNILMELRRLNVDPHRIQRIDGVKADFGALGCAQAHMHALEDAVRHGYQQVLVLEDDFVFVSNVHTVYRTLNKIWAMRLKWDVLMLSRVLKQFTPTSMDFLLHVQAAQTTSGYAVNGQFAPKLLENFRSAVRKLQAAGRPQHEACLDIHWQTLQPNSAWYATEPLLGHQRAGWSDIEQRFVDYVDKTPVDNPARTQSWKHLILIKTCAPRRDRYPDNEQRWQQVCEQNQAQYFYYFGDPTIQQPFVLDETEHTLRVKTEDDYMNLSHKFGQMVHWLLMYTELNGRCQELDGIFFTDDDIEVVTEAWGPMVEKYADYPYWGNKAANTTTTSTWFQTKMEQSDLVSATIREKYPSLMTTPVEISSEPYCSGGGFYLTMPAVRLLAHHMDLFAPFPKSNDELLLLADKGVLKNVCAFDDYQVGVALQRNHLTPKHAPELTNVCLW